MSTVDTVTPTIKEQIKTTFTNWIEQVQESDQALWNDYCERAVELLKTAVYPFKLLKFIVELLDPSYGIAVQLQEQFGDEQAALCNLLKQGRYEEAADTSRNACALMFTLSENPQSVDFGDLSNEEMGTIISIGIVQTSLEQRLTELMTSVEHQAKVISVCIYQLLVIHTLNGKQVADIETLLELVADRLVEVIN